ncbi:hypothetical protein K437DRAFT_266437 [Tilletiaria anomala UBC 951]|uniref:Uncharacterized protein n=1 Tax=Tilletiaria anomala (strain ATCC 24038 / CBS 436.72 / UBC 951) TaxID=1037660 RepID=A0A066WFK7_TILAU|nr:uncharacterized protein K437DRAFT_266437 [Tilletiaria anomala UBC 951]KDN52581.1 hypothetical protein K437DRAFT_266437 [Tilletiaria anomala UBC 951]
MSDFDSEDTSVSDLPNICALMQAAQALRGNSSEARYLTFKSNDMARATTGSSLMLAPASADHSDWVQRFNLHAVGLNPSNTLFNI